MFFKTICCTKLEIYGYEKSKNVGRRGHTIFLYTYVYMTHK